MTPISIETIMGVFALFTAAGMRRPPEWQDQDIMDLAVKLWSITFTPHGGQALQEAAILYITSGGKFWPAPGEVLAFTPDGRKEKADRAEEAWGDVYSSIAKHGRYSSPQNGDFRFHGEPAEHALIYASVKDIGGWSFVCGITHDQVSATRAAFRNAYRERKRRQIEEMAAAKLNMALEVGGTMQLIEGSD